MNEKTIAMMERKEAVTQVLNDLLKINNDRLKEYRKACQEIKDFNWLPIFLSMIDESKKFGLELTLEILRQGGAPKVGSTTTSGKIYRFWMEIKDTLTGKDRESILNECEFVEDAVLKAYTKALEHDRLKEEIRQLIARHLDALRISHDNLTRYRDQSLMGLYKM